MKCLVFLVLLALFSASTSALGGPIDELYVAQAKKACDTKGKLVSQGTFEVPGYFRSRALSEEFGLTEIARELISRRFRFIEMDQVYWTDPTTGKSRPVHYDPLRSEAVGTGAKYYRFFLAPAGSPACAGSNRVVRRAPSIYLPFLRQIGLPTTLCIASEKTDELESRFQIGFEGTRTSRPFGGFEWSNRVFVRDLQTSAVVAEVHRLGYDPGSEGHGFTCPNEPEVQRLFSEILIPSPNAALPPKNEVRVIDNPAEFPITHAATAELLGTKESGKPLSEGDIRSFVNPIAAEGNLSFGPKYVTRGLRTKLTGYYLNVVHPGLTQRILVRAFDEDFWDFQRLTINGETLVFVGHGMSTGKPVIFEYATDGVPLRATRVQFPPIPKSSEYRHFFESIDPKPDHYVVTLLDVNRDGARYRVEKAYVFKVARAGSSPEGEQRGGPAKVLQ